MESIIYIDEDLPEITINELVSVEDDIDIEDDLKKVGINVFSTAELFDQLILLLQKNKDTTTIPLRRKVEGLLTLHSEIINKGQSKDSDIVLKVVPTMTIQRHDVEEEPEKFIEDLDVTNKIDNYFIRRDEKYKAFFNFESTNTEDLPQTQPIGEVELETGDRATFLLKDTISGKINSLKTYQGISPSNNRFKKLTLADKIDSTQSSWKEIPINVQSIEEFNEILLKIQKPYINDYVKSLKDVTDLYDLWKHFMNYGIDLDEYTEPDWNILQEYLEKLRNKDKEVFDFLKPLEHKPSALSLPDIGGMAFYLVQKEIITKIFPILETIQSNLLDLYRLYLESSQIPRINTSNLPKTVYDFAMAIKTPEDLIQAVELYKTMLLNERLNELDQWMKRISQWNSEELEETFKKEFDRYLRTAYSINDEFDRPLISIVPEIKQIKRGAVLSVDRTDDQLNTDAMFSSFDEFTIENEDTDEIPIPIYDDLLPMDISSYEESQRELLEVALRMILEVQKASGLPLDLERIHSQFSVPLRLSKYTQLKDNLPELDESILKSLSIMDMDQSDNYIEALVPTALYQTVKQKIDEVYKSYRNDLFNYINVFFAIWICELQFQVIHRTLNFNIWQGSLNCIQSWSPYGMPMEGFKVKKEGMVNYFLCILHELTFTKGSLWNTYAINLNREHYLSKWVSIFEDEINERVLNLQEEFKTFEKEVVNKGLMEKGDIIKKKIINTVEQRNKAKYLSDYMQFLKNLPSVLIQSSIAKKIHLGCCLQSLNEKYRSDYDWSALVKEAYKIKKLYATQRYGVDKRPSLSQKLKEVESIEKPTFEKNEDNIIYEKLELSKVSEIYEEFKPFMPVNDYTVLLTGARNLVPLIEKYMDIYRFTLRLPISFQEDIYNLTVPDLFQLYRKLQQVQYKYIQLSTSDQNYLMETFHKNDLLYKKIMEIQGYYNEVQEQMMKRLLQYFIVRQLCFPAMPEFAHKNVLVITDVTLAADLIKNFTGKVSQEMLIWVQTKLFNTRIDFKEYIAQQREQENLEKLTLIDQMTPEERRNYVENKKLGLSELNNYLERFKHKLEEKIDNEEILDDFERDGEDEFYPNLGENDDEENPDNLGDDEY